MSDYFESSQLGNRSLATVGIHCILELYNCPIDLLNDAIFIKQALREAAEVAQSTLLNEVTHQFHPQGVTALALLAESHISIHTWPEIGYVAIDVFTCGQQAEPEKACNYFIQAFQASKYLLLKLPRRAFLPDNIISPNQSPCLFPSYPQSSRDRKPDKRSAENDFPCWNSRSKYPDNDSKSQ